MANAMPLFPVQTTAQKDVAIAVEIERSKIRDESQDNRIESLDRTLERFTVAIDLRLRRIEFAIWGIAAALGLTGGGFMLSMPSQTPAAQIQYQESGNAKRTDSRNSPRSLPTGATGEKAGAEQGRAREGI